MCEHHMVPVSMLKHWGVVNPQKFNECRFNSSKIACIPSLRMFLGSFQCKIMKITYTSMYKHHVAPMSMLEHWALVDPQKFNEWRCDSSIISYIPSFRIFSNSFIVKLYRNCLPVCINLLLYQRPCNFSNP